MFERVRLGEWEGFFCDTFGNGEGPLATEEEYANGKLGYAYLSADGSILRRGKLIGTRDDLEFLGTFKELNPSPEGIANLISMIMGGSPS